MFKYLLLPVLLLATYVSSAQNKAIIKGKVIDSVSNSPVEFVTVAVLTVKDTTSLLLSYTITDKTGSFSLHNLPTGTPLKVFISNVAYKPYRKFISFSKVETLDLGNIRLGTNELSELVIKGERPPIVIRKDTIEFNAEAFKTRPNAVVEDLLKKLPGVEVDMSGTISVNGKSVKKVLADGHEFFTNDYRIATKNLDVDLVDKIQVYDDRENDPDHLIPDADVQKIINIKFKKAIKKSYFGKMFVGDGTRGRYTAGGLFNMFRDTLQISVLSLGNNLNNTGFSSNDLYQSGGFNRGGASTFYNSNISLGNSGGLFTLSGGQGISGTISNGIQKVVLSGININTDYGKKLKVNLVYYFSRTQTDNNTLSNNQQFLTDTTITSSNRYLSSRIENRHDVSASLQWRPNDAIQLTYTPSFSYNDNSSNNLSTGSAGSNFVPLISGSDRRSKNTGNNLQFQQSFNYNYQFKKKGESLSISHNLSIRPGDGTGYDLSQLTSYTTGLSSFSLNRNNNSVNRSTNAGASINYRYPFSKKLTGSIGLSNNYSHQLNNNITYDFDTGTGQYDAFLLTLSSTLTRNQWTEGINPGLTYTFKPNMRVDIMANTQFLQMNNRFGRNLPDIDQHYTNVLPNINLNLGGYSIGYQASITMPNISEMIPYTVTSSPLYSVTGNPNLKPTKRNDYTFRYFAFKQKSQVSINANARASFENNSVFRHQNQNSVGVVTSSPVNMDGRYTLSASGSLNKRFKKTNNFQLRTNTSIGAGESRGYFEINRQSGYQNSAYYSLSQQIAFNWKDIIDLEQSYNLNTSITKYTGVNYSNVNYTTHMLNTHLLLTWPKVATIESTYAYTYNPRVSAGFQKSSNLLNLSIAHSLLKKDRGEIKLSGYDILNQSISSYRYVSANYINDNQAEVLRRYFLLTLQFKLNKTIAKK